MTATTLQAMSAKARHRKRFLTRLRIGLLFVIVGVMLVALGRLIYIRKYGLGVTHEPGWEAKMANQRLLEEEKRKMKLPRKN